MPLFNFSAIIQADIRGTVYAKNEAEASAIITAGDFEVDEYELDGPVTTYWLQEDTNS